MLFSLKKILGYGIKATDGEIGKVRQFLFDDEKWVVRYLVVDTGGFLSRNEVLISPIAMKKVSWQAQDIEVSLTKDQVENSPNIDTQRPVSRQQEENYFSYFRWPFYWSYADIETFGPYGVRYPTNPYSDRLSMTRGYRPSAQSASDSHLRSSMEIVGYTIDTNDERVGHVEDFIIDDETWTIRYLVIKTTNFWPSPSVLIATDWVQSIDFHTRTVSTALISLVIKTAPEYRADSPITREYEQKLYDFYGHRPYWVVDQKQMYSEHNVAHTAAGELPDPYIHRIG